MTRCVSYLCVFLVACGTSGSSNGDGTGGTDASNSMADAWHDAEQTDGFSVVAEDGGPTDAGDSGSPAQEPRDELEWVVDEMEVEITDGYSELFSFEVPEGAVSVVVSITGDAGVQYTVSQWRNGDREEVVPNGWVEADPGAPSLCLSCDNRVSSSEASFAAILPNNEGVELVPGSHGMTLYAFRMTGFAVAPLASGTATVRVVAKVADAEPERGVLDVNFHFTGAGGLTAESAQTDEEFQRALTDLDELYEQAGIDLGTVTYSDIPEEYRVIESVVTPNSDLQEMFLLSEGSPRDALNVFVVDELMTGIGNFGVILGVAGGIPGPPFAGTHRSGVAVATKRTPDLETAMFKVLGHEIGHYLGLFHTSEQDLGFGPSIHDPIEDTAEDDPSLLMFNNGEGTTISMEQGRVMRLNPWVQTEVN